MKRKGFFLFFIRSVCQRKGRIMIASLSVTLAVAVVTAMTGLTAGIQEKLGAELRAYGANIILSPGNGEYLDLEQMERIARIKNVEHVSGQVFGNAEVKQRVVDVIGLHIPGIKERGWRLYGKWPAAPGEILAGINLRDGLQLEEGMIVSLTGEGRTGNLVLTGFIERGGAEDSAFVLSLSDAWALLGTGDVLSTLLVRGTSGELEGVLQDIQRMIPSAGAKTSRQTAVAEQSLLTKMQLLMALVTLVVLAGAGISVGSTMGANVIERREEIGLMKAIGATRREIGRFYLAESLGIGFLGGLAGYVCGWLFAQVTSLGAFDSPIAVPAYTVLLSIIFGLVLSAASGYLPVRDALKGNAAVILRGE